MLIGIFREQNSHDDSNSSSDGSSGSSGSSSSGSSGSSDSSSSSGSDSSSSRQSKKALFTECFEKKQNPFKGTEAWEMEIVGEINENMGEYCSDDPMSSEDESETNNNDDFKPMTLEQRRIQM